MARFTHPSISMSASTYNGTWSIEGGTLNGSQPTFDGTPMFSGEWLLIGKLCHFSIDVDMDNITSFGSGQYYVKLPFPSKQNYLMSDGCLHDISTGDEYAVLGHVQAGSDTLSLLTTTSNGKQNPFNSGVPVNLNQQDNFHISGTYIIE
jgi:flagellar hook-length control protein FliK